MKSIWPHVTKHGVVQFIDQRLLPHQLVIEDIHTIEETIEAIKQMKVRGAPLIGVTAAWGVSLGSYQISSETGWKDALNDMARSLKQSRPTAVNLAWAVDQQLDHISEVDSLSEAQKMLWANAMRISLEDTAICRGIGEHGLNLIKGIYRQNGGKAVNILTHCNAGWLACVDYGTATSPMYLAHAAGIPIHVWVDETRPRNQGARLTAWELGQEGIPHTLIADNLGGHLMQHGLVDIVIVGADRVTRSGDVANKIGTYLKALAAKDNNIPFYVALPSSTIDWTIENGIQDIPIEMRGEEEVRFIDGLLPSGDIAEILICPKSTPAVNYGFDVTPNRLITGLISERGICRASESAMLDLFPERKSIGL